MCMFVHVRGNWAGLETKAVRLCSFYGLGRGHGYEQTPFLGSSFTMYLRHLLLECVLTTSNIEGYKEGATYTSTLRSPCPLLHTTRTSYIQQARCRDGDGDRAERTERGRTLQ
jgi:hypothetical protein